MSKSKVFPVQQSLVDKVVSAISPKAGLARLRARAQMNWLDTHGYVSSGAPKRSMRGWTPSANDADSDTIPKLDSLRASSRDLFMNTPMATGAVRRTSTNAVGYGLSLQSHIDRDALGLTGENGEAQADEWERKTEREFRLWANNYDCDAARQLWFPDLQMLAFMSTLMSGDCFVLLPAIQRTNRPYNLRVQVVEADFVSNPQMQFDTARLAGGVEVDDRGAPVKYYFRNRMPNAFLTQGAIADKWTAIDAFGSESGRRNVLHLYEKIRPGQRRGVPLVAPIIEQLKTLTRLTTAELDAALINAMFTVFVKSETPTNPLLADGFVPSSEGIPGAPGTSITDTDTNPADEYVYEMGTGNVVEMAEGDSIEVADAKRPNVNFDPFFISIVKQLGASLEIPYEVLILHFSASYSASRAAILEAWKFFRARRIWLARYFCQPIYEAWMDEAVSSGRVIARGYFNDPLIRQAWLGATWAGPGQGQIDPLKETRASLLKIRGNLSTHEDEFAATNTSTGTWEDAARRRSRENTLIDSLNLDRLGENENDLDSSVTAGPNEEE